MGLREDIVYTYLIGGCREVGVSVFPQAASDRTRGKALNLQQGTFRLDIMKNFLHEKMVKHWNRLSRKVMKSLSLLHRWMWHLGMWFRDALGSAVVGLDDLTSLLQPE